MKNISIIAIPIAFLLFGCAANPIEYQTSASRSDKPTKISYTTQGITIGDFSYNPPGELSQFDISNFGCIPCKDNGSSIGISFTRPIHEIVKYEVSLALSEIILPVHNQYLVILRLLVVYILMHHPNHQKVECLYDAGREFYRYRLG